MNRSTNPSGQTILGFTIVPFMKFVPYKCGGLLISQTANHFTGQCRLQIAKQSFCYQTSSIIHIHYHLPYNMCINNMFVIINNFPNSFPICLFLNSFQKRRPSSKKHLKKTDLGLHLRHMGCLNFTLPLFV